MVFIHDFLDSFGQIIYITFYISKFVESNDCVDDTLYELFESEKEDIIGEFVESDIDVVDIISEFVEYDFDVVESNIFTVVILSVFVETDIGVVVISIVGEVGKFESWEGKVEIILLEESGSVIIGSLGFISFDVVSEISSESKGFGLTLSPFFKKIYIIIAAITRINIAIVMIIIIFFF